MIHAVLELLDDIKELTQGFTAVTDDQRADVLKEIEEVEHLIMSEGAALELRRVMTLVRRVLLVPVTGYEEAVQREILEKIARVQLVASAFVQYYELGRSKR